MTKEELIGKKIKIIESKNKTLVGIKGIVVDETKNLIFVEDGKKTRKIVKDQCVFDVEGKKVSGKDITNRPEERIKK